MCDFGEKKPSDFSEDLVFLRSPDFGRKKPSDFGEDLFFFFFWRSPVFGRKKRDHLVLAGKSLRISAKTFFFWRSFECVISARKNLPISAKTFFFGDHLIFTETSPQSNSGIMKKLSRPDFNFAPPISRSWRRPWVDRTSFCYCIKLAHFCSISSRVVEAKATNAPGSGS